MRFEIQKICLAEENQLINGIEKFGAKRKFFKIGINSKKAANLLNLTINWKYDSCNTKLGRNGYDIDNLIGGGLFVKAHGFIGVTQTGDVGIIFNCADKIKNYVKNGAEAMLIYDIKERLATELKKCWTAYHYHKNENDELKIEGEKISKNEFRVLYETLKNRNENKIKLKYGKEAFISMIGNKIDDQFVIAAIDTIKNEISKIIQTQMEDLKTLNKNYELERDSIYTKFKKDKLKLEIDSNEKISKLEKDLSQIMETYV